MHFEGEVRTEWLKHEGDDRRMRLLQPFVFIDSEGYRWIADPGDTVDGASIPRELWALVGSPFVGDYRRAAVLHDVACQKRPRPSRDVHRMFYEAMRSDGVSESTALRFYTAVRLFGPSWTIMPSGRVAVFSTTTAPQPELSFAEVEQSLDLVLREPSPATAERPPLRRPSAKLRTPRAKSSGRRPSKNKVTPDD